MQTPIGFSMFHCDQEVSATNIYRGFIDTRFDVGCFYKIENSKFLKNAPIQEQDKSFRKELSHYVLRTYDETFHIIAKTHELEIEDLEYTLKPKN